MEKREEEKSDEVGRETMVQGRRIMGVGVWV